MISFIFWIGWPAAGLISTLSGHVLVGSLITLSWLGYMWTLDKIYGAVKGDKEVCTPFAMDRMINGLFRRRKPPKSD
ncbi:MAG: hypothetical protein ACRBEE_05875 [Arenicella sp.]